MVTWSVIAPFLLATAILSVTPGPATALVIRQAARHGVARTLPVIAGIELGVYGWAMLAAVGVAGVVAASPGAFLALKIVGAVVLLGLGIQAWRASFRNATDEAAAPSAAAGGRAFATGLLTNLANPKLMVFSLAFFPQFLPAGAAVVPTTAILAGISVLVDIVYFTGLALAASAARRFFARPKVRVALDRTSGTVFIALAARMATLAR
jgi:threonine/homoserine/homoserine lactone efflux protein